MQIQLILIAPDLNDLPLTLSERGMVLSDKNRIIPCSEVKINLPSLDK
ncbi:MAG TPA: hypothetical protein ACHBX1_15100 [Arsenophonus apicola]